MDPGGNLLTGYQSETELDAQPLTVMAQSAITGNNDLNIEGYRDYRGVPVLGAWVWNARLGFGLTTEIDKIEALRPYYNTRTAIIWFVILILTLATVLAIFGTLVRRQREKEMLDYQIQLEGKVQQRTSELTIQNTKLENALKEIKILSGLLPICSHCKNIRDEAGNWNKLEAYIDAHSEAEFSHGVCPECAIKYFPEIK